MTSENKPASGPWAMSSSASDDWEIPVHEGRTSSSCHPIVDDVGEVVAFAVASYNEWNNPYKEAQLTANALLIAEAGTIFHECGLSPRELLERCSAMEAALQHCQQMLLSYSINRVNHEEIEDAALMLIRAALAKHKEV